MNSVNMSDTCDASYLPECWKDNERMSSLMSMFKLREINPDGYDFKLKFWSDLILVSCRHLKRPYFTHKELTSRYRRKDRIPACLDVVLRHLIAKKEIITIDNFLADNGWISWGLDTFVKKPFSWLFGYKEQIDVLQTEFVVPSVIKEIGQKVVEIRRDLHETSDEFGFNVVEWKKFVKEMSVYGYDEKTLTLVVVHLQKSNLVSISFSHNGEKLLKFESGASTAGPAQITETEKNFIKLRDTAKNLEAELFRLEEEIEKCDRLARLEIKQKNRSKAKSILRRKLQLLKRVKEKETAYNNLVILMDQVAQTKEQKQVFDAYKAGTEAFRSNMARHGLSADKVDETMDDIQEAINDHLDINEALARGSTSFTSIGSSDAELEDELADLLKETPKDDVLELPSVPTSTPILNKPSDRLGQLRKALEDVDAD